MSASDPPIRLRGMGAKPARFDGGSPPNTSTGMLQP